MEAQTKMDTDSDRTLGSRAGGAESHPMPFSYPSIFERVLLRGGRLLTVGWGVCVEWERFMGRHSSALRQVAALCYLRAGSLFSWACTPPLRTLCGMNVEHCSDTG